PGGADGAARGDVGDEVAPKADHVVLEVAAAPELERQADLLGAGVGGEVRVAEGVALVPDLDLLEPVEVVAPVEGHHLEVGLPEALVRAGVPGEPDLVAHARGADHGEAGEAAGAGEPVPAVRRGRGEGGVRPGRDVDVPPEVGAGALLP